MIPENKIYSQFKIIRNGKNSQRFQFKNIQIVLFCEPKRKVKTVSIFKNNKTLIKEMFYKNEEELIFILNRVPQVRFSFPLNTFSKSIVNAFGQSNKLSEIVSH